MRLPRFSTRPNACNPTAFYLLITNGLVGVILLAGWGLRLYGLDWDQGHGLHPDERYIAWVAAGIRVPDRFGDILQPERSALNPYMDSRDETTDEGQRAKPPEERLQAFPYGHTPLYLLVLLAGGDVNEARLALIGRVISSLFDTVTIVLTFALGRLLYGSRVGALAAMMVAFMAIHIQLAHYATFDTALACFSVAMLCFCIRFARGAERRGAVAAGICIGLAVGAKFSGVLLVFPLTIAHIVYAERTANRIHKNPRQSLKDRVHIYGLISLFVQSILSAFLVFALTNPFSVIQMDVFVRNLQSQGAMLRGSAAFPFTMQYRGSWPFLYEIEQLLRWGIGWPIGLFCIGGLVQALMNAWWKEKLTTRSIVWMWVMVYFGFFGSMPVKFPRYLSPLTPVLALYGAHLMCNCWRHIEESQRWKHVRIGERGFRTLKHLRFALYALVVLSTTGYAFAFINVYRGEHPWLRLSRWIYANVSPGATIAHERWDHQLPLTFIQQASTRWPGEFHQIAIDPYAPDAAEKLRQILNQLASSDYLIIASNRLYGSTGRWTERYPLMRRYYESLFGGQLGFRLIPLANIERHPQLGPLAFVADPIADAGLPSPLLRDSLPVAPLVVNLGRADESFTVYDHPQPMLFRNEARLTQVELEQLFIGVLQD